MVKNKINNSGGIGFMGLLTIVFITLKLLEKIDWSWWWVLSPMLISVGLVFIVLIFVVIVLLIGRGKNGKKK